MLTGRLDFLEATVPLQRLGDLAELLGPVEALDRGWRGYSTSALVAGGKGRLAWDLDRPDMGAHFSLGSQALALLAGQDERWQDLGLVLKTLRHDWGGHCTRVDVAFDDVEGLLDLDVFDQAVRDRNFTTRWQGGTRLEGWGKGSGGRTFYFGSKASDCMLRTYDKRAERLSKGHDVEAEHWVRVELQTRRKRADAVAALFERVNADPRGVFRKLAGVLRGYIDFKTPNPGDTNKRRWKTSSWWLAFTRGVHKCKLEVDQVARTLDDVKTWLTRQVAPTLALLVEGMGTDDAWGWLEGEADDARCRLKPRHRAILARSGALAGAGV
jgi:phage replication initiation protein